MSEAINQQFVLRHRLSSLNSPLLRKRIFISKYHFSFQYSIFNRFISLWFLFSLIIRFPSSQSFFLFIIKRLKYKFLLTYILFKVITLTDKKKSRKHKLSLYGKASKANRRILREYLDNNAFLSICHYA